jgi:hypothetical protein
VDLHPCLPFQVSPLYLFVYLPENVSEKESTAKKIHKGRTVLEELDNYLSRGLLRIHDSILSQQLA